MLKLCCWKSEFISIFSIFFWCFNERATGSHINYWRKILTTLKQKHHWRLFKGKWRVSIESVIENTKATLPVIKMCDDYRLSNILFKSKITFVTVRKLMLHNDNFRARNTLSYTFSARSQIRFIWLLHIITTTTS